MSRRVLQGNRADGEGKGGTCRTALDTREAANPELLTPTQIHAIPLLVQGQTVVAVAATLGVGKTTLYDWLKTDAFRAELDHQKQVALVSLVQKARQTLDSKLDDDNGMVAVKAADSVLKHSVDLARVSVESATAGAFLNKLRDMMSALPDDAVKAQLAAPDPEATDVDYTVDAVAEQS